ncbi:MAG: S41 family peptidase [Pirellulales bacterium]|nr:S41 family peptidase [Pirellulales bacterium]
MQFRVFAHSCRSLVLCAAAGLAAPVSAQTTLTIAGDAPTVTTAASVALERGAQLEQQRRWGDALTHYEQALREFPEDRQLAQRLDQAKLHYSLERRYNDRSFLDSVRSLSVQQSLALYGELLRKINTHYVTAPPWTELGVRGAVGLETALSDAAFQAAHRVQTSPEKIAQLRQGIYQSLSRRQLLGPDDLVALAADAAKIAEQLVGAPQSAAILEFVAAAAGGLDDYSGYLTADQLRDVYSQIEGNFVGLGVELKAANEALLIVHVIPGSPAERAGIRDNDLIVAVDGRSTAELSTEEAASLLTGPEGSYVRVGVQSPGQAARQITIRREHVDVPALENVHMLSAAEGPVQAGFGVAYVKIPAFQKSTARELEAALWDLHRQGMRSLVLDLRGNPGGLLTAAVEVADKFITQGNIVATRGRSPQEDFNYQAHYGGTWRVPLVVLIDGDSASASEIFAGAIKDSGRGVVVGQRSYGKGSVQGIFPLGYAGAGIRLTTALFYSPSGQKISKAGVTPDVEVRVVAKPDLTAGHAAPLGDEVLRRGIEAVQNAARQRVATR